MKIPLINLDRYILILIYKSSHQRCSIKNGVLNNFTKSTGKHLCQSLFFNKVAGLRSQVATLLKKRLWHRCFPANFAKFFRTLFIQNIFGRLLLNLQTSYSNNKTQCSFEKQNKF